MPSYAWFKVPVRLVCDRAWTRWPGVSQQVLLRACALAQVESPRVGVLALSDGSAATVADLAYLCNLPASKVSAALGHLVQHGALVQADGYYALSPDLLHDLGLNAAGLPDALPESLPGSLPESLPESLLDAKLDATLDATLDAMPEPVSPSPSTPPLFSLENTDLRNGRARGAQRFLPRDQLPRTGKNDRFYVWPEEYTAFMQAYPPKANAEWPTAYGFWYYWVVTKNTDPARLTTAAARYAGTVTNPAFAMLPKTFLAKAEPRWVSYEDDAAPVCAPGDAAPARCAVDPVAEALYGAQPVA